MADSSTNDVCNMGEAAIQSAMSQFDYFSGSNFVKMDAAMEHLNGELHTAEIKGKAQSSKKLEVPYAGKTYTVD